MGLSSHPPAEILRSISRPSSKCLERSGRFEPKATKTLSKESTEINIDIQIVIFPTKKANSTATGGFKNFFQKKGVFS
jgi:hypothetical protein